MAPALTTTTSLVVTASTPPRLIYGGYSGGGGGGGGGAPTDDDVASFNSGSTDGGGGGADGHCGNDQVHDVIMVDADGGAVIGVVVGGVGAEIGGAASGGDSDTEDDVGQPQYATAAMGTVVVDGHWKRLEFKLYKHYLNVVWSMNFNYDDESRFTTIIKSTNDFWAMHRFAGSRAKYAIFRNEEVDHYAKWESRLAKTTSNLSIKFSSDDQEKMLNYFWTDMIRHMSTAELEEEIGLVEGICVDLSEEEKEIVVWFSGDEFSRPLILRILGTWAKDLFSCDADSQ